MDEARWLTKGQNGEALVQLFRDTLKGTTRFDVGKPYEGTFGDAARLPCEARASPEDAGVLRTRVLVARGRCSGVRSRSVGRSGSRLG